MDKQTFAIMGGVFLIMMLGFALFVLSLQSNSDLWVEQANISTHKK